MEDARRIVLILQHHTCALVAMDTYWIQTNITAVVSHSDL